MDLDIYEHLVRRSLELGVPTAIVAQVFELPDATTKELQKLLRVERFGTADQSEYTDNLQWLLLERTEGLIREGSADQAAKLAGVVFGQSIRQQGKRTSSALEEQRAQMMAALSHVRESAGAVAVPGRFVMGNTTTERRANRDDDDDE